jgi:sortase (surface protein transpeptidase)
MGLLGHIRRMLGSVGQGLSKAQARLHLPAVGSRRSGFVVAAIMLCGGVILLAAGVFGLLKAQPDNDDSLPTGDVRELITPAGQDGALPTATTSGSPDERTPSATATSGGQGEATPGATVPSAGYDQAIPAATVAPLPDVPAPVRMVIEKIGVNAPIITLGLDAYRLPEVPYDPYVVVWYDFSAKPGQGGNAAFAGHVDWTVNGQPVTGVFWGIKDLQQGDVVKILREDGSELQYSVTHVLAIDYGDPEGVKVMYPTPNDVITLVSCGGTWIPDPSMALGGDYTHRIVVRAELVA